MPGPYPPSPIVFFGGGEAPSLRKYAIYYDLFDETLSAGSVDETDSTDGLALREVYDTGNNLSLDDMVVVGEEVTPGDPSLWHKTPSSGPWVTWNGYAHYWRFHIHSDTYLTTFEFGIDDDLTAGISPEHLRSGVDGGNPAIYVNGEGPMIPLEHDETYDFLIVRRPENAGYLYLYREMDGDWQIFWIDEGPLRTV